MYEHLYVPRPEPPVKIAAIQWTGKNHQQVSTFLGDLPHSYRYPGGTISIKDGACGWNTVMGNDYILHSPDRVRVMREDDFNKAYMVVE